MLVLDTHAVLWYTLDPDQLSTNAAVQIKKAEAEKFYCSSISIWELGIKIKNRKLDIGMHIHEYARRLRDLENFEILPVSLHIWLSSLALRWRHTDPADRVIVATANYLDLPLLTKDAMMRKYSGVKTIW